MTLNAKFPDKATAPIAAFDFDKTLIDRDSFPFFLIYSFGFCKTAFFFLLELPALIRFLCGKTDRQQLKESLITRFFRGMPMKEMQRIGSLFAQKKLSHFLRSEALERLYWHQSQGHLLVLVSASLEVYLIPWGEANGFHHILGSRLKVDGEDCVTGVLEGLNCRREEKVKRLREALGSLENRVLYAYGDSEGDKELLEAADFAYYRSFS